MSGKCGSWSMMAMVPVMMGLKAMSGGKRQPGCGQPAKGDDCRMSAGHASRTESSRDIVDAAVSAGVFSRLVEAVTAAGLVETLKGSGPFTVFAPTDDAFAKLAPEVVEAVLKDPVQLKSMLTFHVVPGRYSAADLAGIDALRTVQGTPLKVDTQAGVKVGTAQVVKADVAVSNGVIHVIDSVLLPQ
jgi:uncharacterized surface protein with fasciclin (FAS1) repeats